MKSFRDSLTLSVPVPFNYVYAVSFPQSIHQIIYQFDVETRLHFKLMINESVEIPFQVYRAEGEICKEKIFLTENKQGKIYLLPSFKLSQFVMIVQHNGHLDAYVYQQKITAMHTAHSVQLLSSDELTGSRTSALNSLLVNLD